MEKITSVQNEIVKNAVKLRDSKFRKEKKLFLINGLKLINEAIDAGYVIKTVFSAEYSVLLDFIATHSSYYTQKDMEMPELYNVTSNIIEKISDLTTPQNLIAIAQMREHGTDLLEPDKQYILLENLQDASNVGNILRSAEAFGICAVILVGNKVDVHSSKVLRGSMGSSLRMSMVNYATPAEAHDEIKKAGLHLICATLDSNAKTLEELNFPKGAVVAIGNEGNGLTDEIIKLGDDNVFIEMKGGANSLSAPIAAGIIMYKMQVTRPE